jgi:hypothetical protein
MTIDELQERFDELRKKKWRTVYAKTPAEITGFYQCQQGDRIVVAGGGGVWSIAPDTLSRCDFGESASYIEAVSPYADWPIDAKILVADSDKGPKQKRYFAGVSTNGKPMGWISGGTSWSESHTYEWDYAELAED